MTEPRVISGERFMALADACLVPGARRRYHTSMPRFVPDARVVDIDGPPPTGEAALPPVLRDADIVYCSTEDLPAAAPWLDLAPAWRVLLCHNADAVPDEGLLRLLLSGAGAAASAAGGAAVDRSRRVVFAQNLSVQLPRAFALPIGVANSMWAHGNPDVWAAAAAAAAAAAVAHGAAAKPHAVVRTAMGATHGSRAVVAAVARPDLVQLPPCGVAEYAAQLARARFVLCPPGNGPDAHRLWEALAVRTVPVVIASPFVDALLRTLPGLPLVVVDDAAAMATVPLDYGAFEASPWWWPRGQAPPVVTDSFWAERFDDVVAGCG
jgi:hypothetical protein